MFKPYAGVSTAILLFTKTNSGGTDQVWFYELEADGWSLDDKRQPLLPEEKLGVSPKLELVAEEHIKNNLPDLLERWIRLRSSTGGEAGGESGMDQNGGGVSEAERPRTAQSFLVPKAEIAANGYDLSLNRYKEVLHEAVEHVAPQEILASLAALEMQIQQGMKTLGEMLG